MRQLAWVAAKQPAGCKTGPTAPSAAVQGYADQILGWVKWGTLTTLAICFFACIGMLVWGRVTHHPKGARLGFDGILIILVAAIIYVAGYTVITTITGTC